LHDPRVTNNEASNEIPARNHYITTTDRRHTGSGKDSTSDFPSLCAPSVNQPKSVAANEDYRVVRQPAFLRTGLARRLHVQRLKGTSTLILAVNASCLRLRGARLEYGWDIDLPEISSIPTGKHRKCISKATTVLFRSPSSLLFANHPTHRRRIVCVTYNAVI
jgi:hypothetical protein